MFSGFGVLYMYDLIVLGGGPAGYGAALQAAANGLKVLLIEKEKVGGLCLASGCIPTKSLLKQAKDFAAKGEGLFDMEKAIIEAQKAQKLLYDELSSRLAKSGVCVIEGFGELIGAGVVMVEGREYKGGSILVATGTKAWFPDIAGLESTVCVGPDDFKSLKEVPEHVAVIGGGVSGIEYASFFAMIGSKVSVIENEDEVLGHLGSEFGKRLRRYMKDVEFILGADITGFKEGGINYTDGHGKSEILKTDLIIAAWGRSACTEACEKSGMVFEHGWVAVDANLETSIKGVFAAGDLTGITHLANSAEYMGRWFADHMSGAEEGAFDMPVEASVVYGDPEIASCGWTEAELKAGGVEYSATTVMMSGNSRCVAEGESRGFCKLICEKSSRRILGVHLMGPSVSEIIAVALVWLDNGFTVGQALKSRMPHPGVAEILQSGLESL